MTDQKPEKKSDRDWSTRVGTVKAGSIETFTTKGGEEALRAIVVNAEGKESIVEAFGAPAQEKLRAAADANKPMVFRGPAYFTEGNVPHVMIATVSAQAEPKADAPAKTAEEIEAEKAARAEANKARAAVAPPLSRELTTTPAAAAPRAADMSCTVLMAAAATGDNPARDALGALVGRLADREH